MIAAIVLVALGLAVCEVLAQAPLSERARGPFDFALLTTYGWVIVISLLGGFAAWARKVREGHARAFNVAELIGELIISGFAGIITFLFCRWADLNEWASAAFIGIAGHMGSRAIFLGEQALERWFGRVNPPGGPTP